MRTIEDDLRYCELAIHFAISELCAGRTFYPGYFENMKWEDLSRTDRAICILQSYLGNQELGDPIGFIKIRQRMHKTFLEMQKTYKDIESKEVEND